MEVKNTEGILPVTSYEFFHKHNLRLCEILFNKCLKDEEIVQDFSRVLDAQPEFFTPTHLFLIGFSSPIAIGSNTVKNYVSMALKRYYSLDRSSMGYFDGMNPPSFTVRCIPRKNNSDTLRGLVEEVRTIETALLDVLKVEETNGK